SAPRSAVMRTMAVIMLNLSASPRRRAQGWLTRSLRMNRSSLGTVPLQALDVDVVQCGLHEVRGLLVAHRFAAVQRRLVRLERVIVRFLVEDVELLLELVDRELHAVTRGHADQEKDLPAGIQRSAPPGEYRRERPPALRVLVLVLLDDALFLDDFVAALLHVRRPVRSDVHVRDLVNRFL